MGDGVYTLRGKAVLVSGGSRGLGIEIGRELARHGARLALLARDPTELARARDDIATLAEGEVVIVPCDISDKEQVRRAVTEVASRLGSLDVLINVAGVIEVGPLESMRESDFERAMAINFWGPFHLVDAVLPMMRSLGGGRIANVSSLGGIVAVPHLLPYVASKFALTGFSLGLRAELAKDGIGVSTICPGLMRTGSPANATFKGDAPAEYAWFATADSTPFLSASAEAAARRIVRAVIRNEAMVQITLPAKLAAMAAGFAPGLVSAAMAVANRFLPTSQDPTALQGWRVPASDFVRWATARSSRAAARNNENPVP